MDFPVSAITRPIISKLIALQSFFFARPRIDIDLKNRLDNLYGQRNLGASVIQDHPEPIPFPLAKFEFEFYWNYVLRIKNNSSKAAYNIKIEEIYNRYGDYIEKIDNIASLKDGETIELEYKLHHRQAMTGSEASEFSSAFPGHLDQLQIIVSYTNESRKKFYTRFVATKTTKILRLTNIY